MPAEPFRFPTRLGVQAAAVIGLGGREEVVVDRRIEVVRKKALSFARVKQGLACAGTSLESETYGVGKKTFLFVRVLGDAAELRLKLVESAGFAVKFAAEDPGLIVVGGNGWVKVVLGPANVLPARTLEQWLEESFGAVVGAVAKRRAAGRTARRKPSGG